MNGLPLGPAGGSRDKEKPPLLPNVRQDSLYLQTPAIFGFEDQEYMSTSQTFFHVLPAEGVWGRLDQVDCRRLPAGVAIPQYGHQGIERGETWRLIFIVYQ